MPPRTSPAVTGISGAEYVCLLVDDSQHVAGREDQVLLAVVLDLGAAVLAVDHDVAFGHVQWNPLLAILIPAAGANCDDGAFLRLFLGGVGNDQTGRGRGLGLVGLYEDLVLEWLDVHARHDGALHLVRVSIRGGSPDAGVTGFGMRPCPRPSSRVPAQELGACHLALYT